jgi:hypothetical protein
MELICRSTLPFEEDRLWIDFVRPWLVQQAAQQETLGIANYVVTEMLNNVRDHSQSANVQVFGAVSPNSILLHIVDQGIGVFRKLAEGLGLSGPREAVIEVAKGKRTTDREHHTGQGIFFSSRVCEWFCIEANGFAVTFENDREPTGLEFRNPVAGAGTTVKFRVAREPVQTLREVFDAYCPQPDIEFTRTRVSLHLMEAADGSLVSRSQARRLMAGLDQFTVVELDFAGVAQIGQGFADEAFRVWRLAHGQVKLMVVNANESVIRMLRHVGFQP